ncbi:MAG: LUD domain-containing protein [Gemmatimonadaceae bacterium]|nr:LUD domain-containing protein [Chitinophagaceae bacterium]
MSRESILAAIKQNQPESEGLPDAKGFVPICYDNPAQKFSEVLTGIGGKIVSIESTGEIIDYLNMHFTEADRFATVLDGIPGLEKLILPEDARALDGIEVAVIAAGFGVAENGAVWVTEKEMHHRVLPFICQHLAVILDPATILSNMHEAYSKIGQDNYGFAAFIAGPSKTADIEQSLVLGAHGPKTMTIFLLSEK